MIDSEMQAGEQAAEQAPRGPALRPYLPDRHTLHHLCSGSTALTRRIFDWTTADGLTPFLQRLGMLGGAGYIAVYIDRHVTPLIAPGIAGAWCLAALALSRHDHTEPDDAAPLVDDDEDEWDDEPAPTPEDIHAATLNWIRQAIGNRNGIHLSDLLANAHHHGLLTTLDTVAFRDRLEHLGIPVRQQLKVGGRNRPGIHRDDLTQHPEQAPSPEVDDDPATAPATAA